MITETKTDNEIFKKLSFVFLICIIFMFFLKIDRQYKYKEKCNVCNKTHVSYKKL